jgi:hypothetical protein
MEFSTFSLSILRDGAVIINMVKDEHSKLIHTDYSRLSPSEKHNFSYFLRIERDGRVFSAIGFNPWVSPRLHSYEIKEPEGNFLSQNFTNKHFQSFRNTRNC